MVSELAKAIGHLGHRLTLPLIKGPPNSNNILYNITFSSRKKKKRITNGHHQIPSGHEGPFLTEARFPQREKKKEKEKEEEEDYKWPSPNPIKP